MLLPGCLAAWLLDTFIPIDMSDIYHWVIYIIWLCSFQSDKLGHLPPNDSNANFPEAYNLLRARKEQVKDHVVQ